MLVGGTRGQGGGREEVAQARGRKGAGAERGLMYIKRLEGS